MGDQGMKITVSIETLVGQVTCHGCSRRIMEKTLVLKVGQVLPHPTGFIYAHVACADDGLTIPQIWNGSR